MPMNQQNYDIAIIGSGIVGAAAALALAKNTSLHIVVLEAKTPSLKWQPNPYDSRVSAVSLSSKYFFEHLQVWDAIKAKRVSPYHHMQVWDAAGSGEIDFAANALQEDVLGYIVEDSVMRVSLLEKFKDYSNLDYIPSVRMTALQEHSDHVLLTTDQQKLLKTKLVIAADGAESWVRQQAGIELKTWDYRHVAIVATVQTELPHDAIARQRFMSTGPLAFLPLSESNMSSIVWSATPEYAAELLSLEDMAFAAKLAEAFGHKLGNIKTVSARHSFPLRMRHAKNYVRERIALIGDAAHTVHPLAGQGVNLGLLDAATLAEVIMDAHKKNRSFSSLATLRRYERWRKGDTLAMLAMVETLKHLFASELKSIQYLRNAGLSITNKMAFLKECIASHALGKRQDLPVLAQQY